VFTLPYLYYSANLGPKVGFIYTGTCLISLAYVYFCVGEVTGRSMEEIEGFFQEVGCAFVDTDFVGSACQAVERSSERGSPGAGRRRRSQGGNVGDGGDWWRGISRLMQGVRDRVMRGEPVHSLVGVAGPAANVCSGTYSSPGSATRGEVDEAGMSLWLRPRRACECTLCEAMQVGTLESPRLIRCIDLYHEIQTSESLLEQTLCPATAS